jgi:hypothetical protein
MTGAIVGSVVGIGVPPLFHSRRKGASSMGETGTQALEPAVKPMFSLSGKL